MAADEIEWVCAVCGQPVADEHGYITVNRAMALQAERENQRWDEEHQQSVTIEELSAGTKLIDWKVLHAECDPKVGDDEEESYTIAIADVRTYRSLLFRSLDLVGKTWLKATDWTSFLKRSV
jgi:hypothetical protein